MFTNPSFLIAAIALILMIVSYWHAPTLGIGCILLAVAVLVLTVHPR